MIRALIKRSGVFFVGSLYGRIGTTILFILLARSLNPNVFGQMIYLVTLLELSTILGNFGLTAWYQKKVAQNPSQERQILHKVVFARAITLFISIVLMAAIVLWRQSFSVFLLSILLLLMILESFLLLFDGFYLARKEPKTIALKSIIKVSVMVVSFFFIRNILSVNSFSVIYLLSSLASFIYYVPFKELKKAAFTFSLAFQTLKESSSYALLISSAYVYARGDTLLIEFMLGAHPLGLYSAAYRFLESISLIPASLASNLFHVSAQSRAVSAKQLTKITALMGLSGGLFALSFYFLSDFLTTTLLGSEYSPASIVVKIFSVVVLLFFLNSPLSTVVQSSNYLKKFLPWGIANTILNILLNLVYIPVFGIVASAVIMIITESTGLIINLFFVRRIYHEQV